MGTYGIGIISYLPNDIDYTLRSRRLKSHLKQLDDLNKLFPDVPVVEVQQNYDSLSKGLVEQKLNNGLRSWSVMSFSKGITSACARNEILRLLYDSESLDYVFLPDDDALVYPYYDAKNFLEDISRYKEPLGVIRPMSPMMMPFKKENYHNKEEVEKYWVLVSSTSVIACGSMVHCNYKKFYGKELYFDKSFDPSKETGYEDYEFILNARRNGIPSYTCMQLVAKIYNSKDSSIFQDEQSRLLMHRKNVMKNLERYKDLGVQCSLHGTELKHNAGKVLAVPTVYVPRGVPYEFDAKVTPKVQDRKPKKRSLI